MIFYDYFRSSCTYRCRIALNLLGLKPERRYIHLGKGEHRSAEYLNINPQLLVPALDVDGEVITQSVAIIEYLNEIKSAKLLGNSPHERAKIRSFAQAIACDIHPLQNLRVLNYIATEFDQTEQAQKDKWCQKWLGDGLKACEAIATKEYQAAEKKGKFTFGDEPTMADIFLIPQLFSANRFKVDLSEMPRLQAINNHCLTLSPFSDAAPHNQPDAE